MLKKLHSNSFKTLLYPSIAERIFNFYSKTNYSIKTKDIGWFKNIWCLKNGGRHLAKAEWLLIAQPKTSDVSKTSDVLNNHRI